MQLPRGGLLKVQHYWEAHSNLEKAPRKHRHTARLMTIGHLPWPLRQPFEHHTLLETLHSSKAEIYAVEPSSLVLGIDRINATKLDDECWVERQSNHWAAQKFSASGPCHGMTYSLQPVLSSWGYRQSAPWRWPTNVAVSSHGCSTYLMPLMWSPRQDDARYLALSQRPCPLTLRVHAENLVCGR